MDDPSNVYMDGIKYAVYALLGFHAIIADTLLFHPSHMAFEGVNPQYASIVSRCCSKIQFVILYDTKGRIKCPRRDLDCRMHSL